MVSKAFEYLSKNGYGNFATFHCFFDVIMYF